VIAVREAFLNFLRGSIFLLCSLLCTYPAIAADFQQPTPEELKMTSDPAARDADVTKRIATFELDADGTLQSSVTEERGGCGRISPHFN
jgi:hypothetical protein